MQFSCFSCCDQHPVLSSFPLGWHFCLVWASCGHLVCPGCQKHWFMTWGPLVSFWIIVVMLIFLIKIGSISIKNKLWMVLSKQIFFAGLSLLINKVSASSAWCFWACGFMKKRQDWNLAQGTSSLFICDCFPPLSLAWELVFCSAGSWSDLQGQIFSSASCLYGCLH